MMNNDDKPFEEFKRAEEGINLDDEDEEILDRVWAEVGLEILEKQEQEKASNFQKQHMNGRTIKIHLPQGTTRGIMTAEITVAWTGKLLAFPRTQLATFKQREESRRAGVYILIGEDEEIAGGEVVYVGETEDLWQRLYEHNRTKDFWNRTVVITSKDEHLTKSLVRYLESYLTKIVDSAKRARRIGGATPELPKLPESDRSDMEYFASQIELILPVLGFNFVVPVPQVSSTGNAPSATSVQTATPTVTVAANNQPSPVFVCTVPFGGGIAKMQESGGEFVVFAGSKAAGGAGAGFPKGYAARRDQLLSNNSLVPDSSGGLVFKSAVPFRSTSAAASIIKGSAVAGPSSWIVEETTQTYGEWQATSDSTTDSPQDETVDDSSTSDGSMQPQDGSMNEEG